MCNINVVQSSLNSAQFSKMKKEATDSKAVAFLEMTKTKVRAYIGRAEEAEDYVVDNEYI